MGKNSNKLILDLCGGTGAWSKPYKDAGYDVRLITLPEYDVTKVDFVRIGGLLFRNQDDGDDMLICAKDVYGILAAPPCTEFSLAKGSKPRDLSGAIEVVKACFEIIWECRTKTKLKFWALENPKGLLRQFIGIPVFMFEHWEFGDWQIKPTDLWGYFNKPRKRVTERPPMMTLEFPNGRTNGKGWAKPECPQEYKHLGLTRKDIRAITPPGFSKAFFKANR